MTALVEWVSRRGFGPAARPFAVTVLIVLVAAVLLGGCAGSAPAAGPQTSPSPTDATDPTDAIDAIDSSAAGSSLVGVADPAVVRIPAIGVDAALVELGLRADGAMQVPDFGLAGWYVEGPRPGEIGPAVVAAHVDSTQGPDVFYRLRELAPGDRVSITDEAGADHTFVVERTEQHDKDALPVDDIWGPTDGPVLRLITCGGVFDRGSGHYRDNIIVYATGM